MGAVWMEQLERTTGYAGFFMYRMYGIAQRARDGGARMYRMYGIAQRARDGGAPVMPVFLRTVCTV